MEEKDFKDMRVIEQLEGLRETAPRDPKSASAARAAFLAEAGNLAQGVSPRPFHRLVNWMAAFSILFAAPRQKRGVPMFATVVTLILAISLAFGGGAMAASQYSMPDDTLYPMKLWSEEARLSLSPDAESQLRLSLEFSARRMEEIQTMLQDGQTPPDAVMTRLQNQMNTALNLAANMPDGQAQSSLLQVQIQLQQQEQMMTQLQLQEDANPALLQTRSQVQTMLQQQMQLCESGLEDPLMLQEQLRTREQDQTQQKLNDGTQTPQGDQSQDQTQEQTQTQEQLQNQTQTPIQNQNQFQYGATMTPMPPNGNGKNGGTGGKP